MILCFGPVQKQDQTQYTHHTRSPWFVIYQLAPSQFNLIFNCHFDQSRIAFELVIITS
jgi:hypothetical protein